MKENIVVELVWLVQRSGYQMNRLAAESWHNLNGAMFAVRIVGWIQVFREENC